MLAKLRISPNLAACLILPWIPFFFSLGQSLLARYVITKLANCKIAKPAIPNLQVVTRSGLLMNRQMLVKHASLKNEVR